MTFKIQGMELNEKPLMDSQPCSLNEKLLPILANISQMKPMWPWEMKVNLAKTLGFTVRVHSSPHDFCKFSTLNFMVLTCCSCVCS